LLGRQAIPSEIQFSGVFQEELELETYKFLFETRFFVGRPVNNRTNVTQIERVKFIGIAGSHVC